MTSKNSQPATQIDLKELEVKLTGRMDNLEIKLTGNMDKLDKKLTGRMDNLEIKLTGQMDKLDKKLTGRMDKLDKKLTRNMDKLDKRLSRGLFDLKLEIDSLDEKMDRKFAEFTDRNLSIVSEVLGELKDMREERLITTDRSNENRERLENHEERIDQLEQVAVSL